MTQALVTFVALAVASLAGCAGVTAADKAPRTDPVARLEPVGPAPWRVDFGDPVLDDLLRRADAGALDVKVALARLAKAQAGVGAARAARKIHLGVGLDAAAGGRTLHDAGSAATPSLDITDEIDLGGRLRRTQQAAENDRVAAATDVAAARLVIGAETTRAYEALRLAEAQIQAADRRRDLAVRGVTLTARRATEGSGSREAVEQARGAAARTEDQVAWWREERDLQAGRLADLIGVAHVDAPAGAALSAPAGGEMSSDLVDERPDVQAALARLKAADFRRGAAVAAARPQFMISAMLGSANANIATLLDARTVAWAVAASITHNVLSGGANRARITGANAEADEADLTYRKTVLAAWSEMRAALIETQRAGRETEIARGAANQAAAALQVGERRHREGLIDGLQIAALQDGRETAATALASAAGRQVEARVRLALAAGGQ